MPKISYLKQFSYEALKLVIIFSKKGISTCISLKDCFFIRFELKAWQLARQKVGQKIRKKVWDDMEVKGRSINGIHELISVANYPMVPMTFEEMDALEEVLAERKLSKEIAKASGDLHGNVPQLPPIPGRPTGPDALDERILGSKSYEFVDVSACMPFSQLEVTTRSQAKQQIILLQVNLLGIT